MPAERARAPTPTGLNQLQVNVAEQNKQDSLIILESTFCRQTSNLLGWRNRMATQIEVQYVNELAQAGVVIPELIKVKGGVAVV